ncbi:MAG: protein translocase subunit SecD [bacterium]|nr:protein translocase subunit SecD [bacterium]
MAQHNRYSNKPQIQKSRRPIRMFMFVLLITAAALAYNLPVIKVNQTIFGKKIDTIGGYSLFGKNLELKKGLDLQGGVQLTLQADMKGIEEKDKQAALDSARNVIDRRVNLYGVSEPVVQSAKSGNDYRVIVELPGITDMNQALDLVGRTAKLEFREPDMSTESAEKQQREATASAMFEGLDASTAAQLREYIASQTRFKPTQLTGKELKRASVTFNQQNNEPQVNLEFKPEGTKMFAELTKKYVGQQIAIYLDEDQVSAPNVNVPITDGNAVISGGFTVPQAQQLATQLNAGALPIPIHVIEQRTIGATLGNRSVERSIIAGIIGVSLVALFMLLLYGFQGLLADCALILYALISLFLFRFIPVTLTLAGIAGFILSIGMALDANILIFERMREEIRWGRSKKEALRLGFDRAWSSIRDSNLSSLITCVILYSFGTGMIRGFALTLAIGILVSLFTAITVSRTLLRMFIRD